MVRRKSVDYGITWWDCDYCKLSHVIMNDELPCVDCNMRSLEGAVPVVVTEKGKRESALQKVFGIKYSREEDK